jgi:hypothetical protein
VTPRLVTELAVSVEPDRISVNGVEVAGIPVLAPGGDWLVAGIAGSVERRVAVGRPLDKSKDKSIPTSGGREDVTKLTTELRRLDALRGVGTGVDADDCNNGTVVAAPLTRVLTDRQLGPWHRSPSRSRERLISMSGGGDGRAEVDMDDVGLDVTGTGVGLEIAAISVELPVDRQLASWHRPPRRSRERFISMSGGGDCRAEFNMDDVGLDITGIGVGLEIAATSVELPVDPQLVPWHKPAAGPIGVFAVVS